VHDEAANAADTDWPQIVALYDLLRKVAPGPVTELNPAVAVAMADGPTAGLALIDALDDPRLARDHRLHATRAHLLEMSGDPDGARAAYLRAAGHATNERHVRYLLIRAERLGDDRR
jgi:predicted RNA polymerase sigma factor